MAVERRINVPDRDEFASTVEQLKDEHLLDEILAEYVIAKLPAERQGSADRESVARRVRQTVDPRLIDVLYEPYRGK